jgi:hypothetical protein
LVRALTPIDQETFMSSPDEIRRQMELMRAALTRDAREAASDARALFDWRNHFRRHPWLCCGAAAVVGYLVVPRRAKATPESFSIPMAAREATIQEPAPTMRSQLADLSGGLLGTAASMAATALVRKSIAHLVDRGRRQMEQPPHPMAHTNGAHSEHGL